MGWMDCVKRRMNERAMSLEQGWIIVYDRGEKTAVIHARGLAWSSTIFGLDFHISDVIC